MQERVHQSAASGHLDEGLAPVEGNGVRASGGRVGGWRGRQVENGGGMTAQVQV